MFMVVREAYMSDALWKSDAGVDRLHFEKYLGEILSAYHYTQIVSILHLIFFTYMFTNDTTIIMHLYVEYF